MTASRFTLTSLVSRLLGSAAFVALSCAGSACAVGVGPAYEPGAVYPPGDYPPGSYPAGAYDDYPPDTYIATTVPVYFDGRASYWYGDRWYYRDGARWNYYHSEPPELARHRLAAPPARRTYEHYQGGHSAGRSAGRGGGHGHR